MLAAIEGPDILIVLAVVLLLFGSTQIPKLARSLGSASREFKKGQEKGDSIEEPDPATPVVATPLGAPTAATPVVGSSATNGSCSTP